MAFADGSETRLEQSSLAHPIQIAETPIISSSRRLRRMAFASLRGLGKSV